MAHPPISILVVEDSESDFDLLSLRLAHQGFPVELERVETERDMRRVLASRRWDLVISDHKLPQFSLAGALRVLHEHDPEIPLIVVSGAIGEEAAVDAMLDGADDFIMKGNLSRLAPAITRSIHSAQTRRGQRLAEAALRERESMLRSLSANLPAMMFRLDYDRATARFGLPYAGEGSQRMFGVDPAVLREDPAPLLAAIAPEDRRVFFGRLAEAARVGTDLTWQGRTAGPGGGERWVQLSATLLEQNDSSTVWDGIIYDVTDAKNAEREIRELTAHLEGVKEAERAAVAREIHDDIGATFFGIKVDLAWLKKRLAGEAAMLERIETIGAQIDSGVQASQRIVRSLRPAVLDYGVIGAAEWLAGDFAKRTGMACSFSTGVEELPLVPELGTAVFRVMQESLTNILRHANATEVTVRIEASGGEVRLDVRDNGRGITPGDLAKRSSFGVRGMRERVRDLGGALDIISAPDGGTRLCLRLPLRLAEAEQEEA